jgi:hypothetical protein
MKKYFFGMGALVLALSLSAFTVVRTNTQFKYKLTTFAQADVQNPVNYQTFTGSITCGGADKACLITVDPSETVLVGTTREIDGTQVTIQALDPDANGKFDIDQVVEGLSTATWANKP